MTIVLRRLWPGTDRQDVAQWDDLDLIDGLNRPLGGRVVPAQRFDRVADVLDPDGLSLSRRVDVDDSAADSKLAVLVRGIFAAESGIDQQLTQIRRGDFLSRPKVDGRVKQTLRRADAREQRRRGSDNDASRGSRQRMERPRARRGDADVRRQSAIRVDLMRGKRQHRPIRGGGGKSLQGRQKEAHIADGLLEVAVAWHDVQDNPVRHRVRCACDEQGLGGRRQP